MHSKKAKMALVLSLATTLIFFLTGCSAFGLGSTPATPPAPTVPTSIPQLESRINSLESRIATLTPTDTSALQAELTQLRTDYDAFVATATINESTIAELAASISELNDRVAALELPVVEPVPTVEETARWYPDVYSLNYPDITRVGIDYKTSPSKIIEADDYTIYVAIYNYGARITDLQLGIVFTPKTGSRVIVDEDEISLDTATSPYYTWEAEIATRSKDGTCKWIEFTTDKKFVIPVDDLDPLTAELELKLIFTLAYK